MKRFYLINLLLLASFALFAQEGKETNLKTENNDTQSRFLNRKEKGYYCTMNISILLGRSEILDKASYYLPPYSPQPMDIVAPNYYYRSYSYTRNVFAAAPSFTFSNGFLINKNWAAGAGVGYEIFQYNLFPLFAELRYTLWDHKISPYWTLKGGYAFGSFKSKHNDELYLNWSPYYITDVNSRNYGGFMFHPEIGVKVPLNENSDLLFTVAYRYQKTKTVVRKDYGNDQFDEWEHKENLNRLAFGIAIMFR